jgi:hypothetical protein
MGGLAAKLLAEVLQIIKPRQAAEAVFTPSCQYHPACSAEFGNLLLYKDDRFHVAVLHGAPRLRAWQREPASAGARPSAFRSPVSRHQVVIST